MTTLYDKIGQGYSAGRQTDPYIASQIYAELQGAESILNIGAGTGSYEPPNINLIAIEPSIRMIRQRLPGSHPVLQASSEYLPFTDKCFSHTMTVLSMHHWQNRTKAFAEIERVTRESFVAVTWLPESNPFWLTQDYFPELYETDRLIFPNLDELYAGFKNITIKKLPIPADCKDGFMAAYWRRPRAYLDENIRRGISTFYKLSNISTGLLRLENELNDGRWYKKYGDLLNLDFLDVGYRIITAHFDV